MKQAFIDIKNLKLSPLNVRKHGDKDGKDLVPSIKANGVIQSLLVRKNCEGYEVLAGQRRYNAALAVAKEQDIEPLPCLILEEGDDAAAIEASLAENIARLPMDELDQFEAFRQLSKQGRSIDDIASAFGVTDRLVKQRLALADLHPPILKAYREREDIGAGDLRLLTMATKKQQRAWWKLAQSKEEYPPFGHRLKSWLFDGDAIPVSNALFDIDSYKGAITSDLFGDEQYFSDSAKFWEHQSRAIAELAADYKDDGWPVIIHDVGQRWYKWDCVQISKEEGGEIHITCAANGEVSIHEGYLDEKLYRKRQKAEGQGDEAVQVTRPELTKPMQNYLGLHRHAAVRKELLDHQGVALRLMVAQVIASSHADSQHTQKDETTASLKSNKAEAPFKAERAEVRALLGLTGHDTQTLIRTKDEWERGLDPQDIFAKLRELDDDTVLRILTFVMAEILPSNGRFVEILGRLFATDMKDYWTPDDVFFDLFKDKEAINAALKDCAGERVADGNVSATAKVQKGVIQACLSGARKDGNKDWQPAYMSFPMGSYTQRGGIEAVKYWEDAKALFEAA